MEKPTLNYSSANAADLDLCSRVEGSSGIIVREHEGEQQGLQREHARPPINANKDRCNRDLITIQRR